MRRFIALVVLLLGLGSGVGPGCTRDSSGDKESTSAMGFCAATCLKACANDDECDPSRGQVCGDYGDDGKACVAAAESPRLCDSDSECEGSEGEACLRTVVTTTQRECTVPSKALSSCKKDAECAVEDGDKCCTIYRDPICLPVTRCPVSCKKNSDCEPERGEICCTSVSVVDPALGVTGLCLDPTEEPCPTRCTSSGDCSRADGELCCNGVCSTACEKPCQASDDCPGQICCKTRAARSALRLHPKVGYRVSSRSASGKGGAETEETSGLPATGGRATGGAKTSGGRDETGGVADTSTSGTAGLDDAGGSSGPGTNGGTADSGRAVALGGNPFTGGGGTAGPTDPGGSGGTGGSGGNNGGFGNLFNYGTGAAGAAASNFGGFGNSGQADTGGSVDNGGGETSLPVTNPVAANGFGTAGTGQHGYWYTESDSLDGGTSQVYPWCPDPCFAESGDEICVAGEGAEVTDGEDGKPAYARDWGVRVGWNVNQAEGEDTTANSADLSMYTSITVALACGPGSTSNLRLMLDLGDASGYCTSIMCGSNLIAFTDFRDECWAGGAQTELEPSVLEAVRGIRIWVYTATRETTPFDFCVTEVSFR